MLDLKFFQSSLYIMFLCFDYSFPGNLYLLLHTDRLHVIFHLLLLLPALATYVHLLIILIPLLSFLDMLAMPTLVAAKIEQDQVHMFRYICLKSFQIHGVAAHTNDDNQLILFNSRFLQSFFSKTQPWGKKSRTEDFDVPMRCYDGVEVCEWVESWMLNQLNYAVNEEGIGLYQDYGLEVFHNTPIPEIERKNKQLKDSKNVDYLSPFSV